MKNLLLFIVSILLILLFTTVSIIIGTYLFVTGKISSKYYFENAIQVDVLGNVMCQFILNWIFIKPNGYKFGKRGETISSVLGKNLRNTTLTATGNIMVIILNYFQPNHCILSIID